MSVEFSLGEPAWVSIEIIDVQGRVLAVPVNGHWKEGLHRVAWAGQLEEGRVAPGVYFLRYRHPGGEDSRKVVRTH
jgi:hypothetical protein